jgi:hypothetical protein
VYAGYGAFAPATDGGKVFTLLLALFGMVIYGLANGMLATHLEAFIYHATQRISGKPSPKCHLLVIAVVIASFMCAMAAVYSTDPSIGDFNTGLWFSFVTCSTIGFGDYTPSSGSGGLMYSGQNYVWVFGGCAIMSLGLGALAKFQLRQQQRMALLAGLNRYITLVSERMANMVVLLF